MLAPVPFIPTGSPTGFSLGPAYKHMPLNNPTTCLNMICFFNSIDHMLSQCMWWAGEQAECNDGSCHSDISATTTLCTSSPIEQAGPVCLLNIQYSSLSLFFTEQASYCETICSHMQTDDLNSGYIKYSTEATCFQQGHSTKNTPTQAANGNPTDYRRLRPLQTSSSHSYWAARS